MSQLFNFKTISISLNRELKNCKIEVLNSCTQFSTHRFVEELEQVFDWLSNKTEISSLLIETQENDFSLLTKKDLKYSDLNALSQYFQKVQRLAWGQIILPQTIIWNFRSTADFLALELASGADLVTCSPSFTCTFDILKKGISPSCGTNGLLSKKVGINKLKSYIMTNKQVSAEELLTQGIVSFVNYGDDIEKSLKEISKQSPIARIQFKRSINDSLILEMDDTMTTELSFARASLEIGDWTKWANDKEFSNPREYARMLRSIPTEADVQKSANC